MPRRQRSSALVTTFIALLMNNTERGRRCRSVAHRQPSVVRVPICVFSRCGSMSYSPSEGETSDGKKRRFVLGGGKSVAVL